MQDCGRGLITCVAESPSQSVSPELKHDYYSFLALVLLLSILFQDVKSAQHLSHDIVVFHSVYISTLV